MSILGSIIDSFTGGAGGLAKDVVDTIKQYYPPEMTPEQKLQIQLAVEQMANAKTLAAVQAQQQAEKDLNDRIAMYEGTASDVKSMPFIGPILVTLRGLQRPAWGFATLYLDYGVFSGLWKLTDPVVANSFWVVNFLVLGFLFGERAVMNVMPFVTDMLATKNQKPQDVSVVSIKQ